MHYEFVVLFCGLISVLILLPFSFFSINVRNTFICLMDSVFRPYLSEFSHVSLWYAYLAEI